jgi:hypothetical protein
MIVLSIREQAMMGVRFAAGGSAIIVENDLLPTNASSNIL